MTSAVASATEIEGLNETPMSTGELAWRRFRKHRGAMVGGTILVILLLLFIFGPTISGLDPYKRNVRERNLGPSMDHLFGTDSIGRDLFVRLMTGGQYSVRIGLIVALVSTALGTTLGALGGYFGGWVDNLINQLLNLVQILPFLIVLIVFSQKFGKDPNQIALVLAALLWTRIARVVRGVIMQVKEQEFVQAAKAAGAKTRRILFRHLLPNVIGPVIVEITLLLGTAIVLESTLSFLGFGPEPPATTLGKLIYEEKGNLDNDPIRVLIPAFFIVVFVLCVNFLGDGLRDALDPKTKVEKG